MYEPSLFIILLDIVVISISEIANTNDASFNTIINSLQIAGSILLIDCGITINDIVWL